MISGMVCASECNHISSIAHSINELDLDGKKINQLANWRFVNGLSSRWNSSP